MFRSKMIILVGFTSILVLISLIIIIGVTNLNKSKSRLDKVIIENSYKNQLVHQMHQSARERTIVLKHMLLLDSQREYERSIKKIAFFGGQFVEARMELLSMNLSEQEKEILDQQSNVSKRVVPYQHEVADLVVFGELEKAQQLLITKVEPLQNEVFKVLSRLHNIQRTETREAIHRNSESYQETVFLIWVVTIIVILICLAIVFFTLKIITRNEKEQQRYQQEIEKQAFFDQLTGLPNRRLLNDRMQHAILHTSRSKLLLAVMFIDCDRFKLINDTLGHVKGDELLISISQRLLKNVRKYDTVCRVSGDEFAVILEDIEHISDVDRIANNILKSIAEPHFLNDKKVFATVSIGITIYPQDEKDINGLLISADTAMYHVKKMGGNQFEYFNEKMNLRSKQRLMLEQDLHEALKNNELEVYYQPLNAINRTRDVVGVEALLRWNHPSLGLVSPVDFISIAEETGLIISIGEWVLNEACKQIKCWELSGFAKLSVSVNLSPRQFLDNNLVVTVQHALDNSNILASQLDLEITESTAMDSIEHSIEILHKLKHLGVKISIDDFGTGYSSLSYLQKMPIDSLKIDRSFITHLHQHDNDNALVEVIITMAHRLGMKVIAEGVETEQQLTFLSSADCEIAQGYLFSKPVKADKLTSLL